MVIKMIKDILKGIIIGLANIIPGVSGGTMAVSMGIYDKLIHCVSHLFSEIKENILFLAPIAVGMVIAIIASSFGIDYLFDTYPVQTNMMFIGLILGSLPSIYVQVKSSSIKIGYIICAVLFFAIVVGMALMNGASGHETDIDTSFLQVIILFLVGIIAAGTMVIPGVSGSMMLLLLGYYNPILDTIKKLVVGLVQLDFQIIFNALFVLVPFGIGVLVGIIVIAKIIEIVLQKFPMYVYWSIIGLLVASPVAIIIIGKFPDITLIHIITGIIAFMMGWVISRKLGE